MNRQAEGFIAREPARPAAGGGTSARVRASARRRRGDLRRRHPGDRGHPPCGAGAVREGARADPRRSTLRRCARAPGVVAVLTAADIPGANDCGPIVHDDPILADGLVQYVGQPMFVVVAESYDAARRAARMAKVDYDVLPPVLTPQEAKRLQSYVLPPMHLTRGEPAAAMAAAPRRLSGEFYVGGQEQFYLEGQISYAIPREDGCIHLYCSTQHPTEMQHVVAHALDLVANQVTVEMRRMGGGFGGKESQSALFACVAAVAAQRLRRPVKIRLDRDDDFLATGKRHCFHYDYEIGFGDDGVIRAAKIEMAARAGFSADLSGPVCTRADLPLRQRVLSARRGHSRAGGQDQHAVEHRVSRLRRPAGRHRHRVPDRQHRARAGARSARRPQGEFLRHERAQRHAVRHDRRGQRDPRARRRARGIVRTTGSAAPRSAPSMRRARC